MNLEMGYLHFDNQINKLFSFFLSQCFLKEIDKTAELLVCHSCSHSISHSPKLPLMFLYLDRNTEHVFYFLSKIQVTDRHVKLPKWEIKEN